MKEVDKALADQKVSGRRMVIEEVEGSDDEEPLPAAGPVLPDTEQSSDQTVQEAVNKTDVQLARDVLSDKTNEQVSPVQDATKASSHHNADGSGDADTPGPEARTDTQSVTGKGDTASADDNMPAAVVALKDAGNDLFRRGQYGDALDKYNAAVQFLGKSIGFCELCL